MTADARSPDDALAAEIASHRPCACPLSRHREHCADCNRDWPCLVRRLADNRTPAPVRISEALSYGRAEAADRWDRWDRRGRASLEALAWYADPATYQSVGPAGVDGPSPADLDGGERARAALAAEGEATE